MKNSEHDHAVYQAPLVRGYTDSYLKLTKNRAIFFSEDVSDVVASELAALLIYYDHADNETPISLYIHSNGGAVSGLNCIYDVMQMIHAPIKTILLGKCYSAGAVMLAAGQKGERYALRSSQVMIHSVQFSFPDPTEDLTNNKNNLEFLNDINDILLKMLAKHTGQPLDKLKNDCAREYWMSAEKALEYGMVDVII